MIAVLFEIVNVIPAPRDVRVANHRTRKEAAGGGDAQGPRCPGAQMH
jgi:hypothetical protein